MDPTPAAAGGLAHLEQYGALGIIAAALLGLVLLLVKRFVDHAIESNKQLQQQNTEMQRENLKAMHAMVTEIKNLGTTLVHEVRTGIATVHNDREPTQPRYRPRYPSRGGGGGGDGG